MEKQGEQIENNTAWLIAGLIIVAAFFRLLPHPANFVPTVALSLYGGAKFSKKGQGLLVVFGSMLLSDIFLGFHETLPYVYFSLLIIFGLGTLLKNRVKVLQVGAITVASSILFFLVTNFGVWASQSLYPKTMEGLITCYVAAIPFFRNALAGDFLFVAVLFGLGAFLERKVQSRQVFVRN